MSFLFCVQTSVFLCHASGITFQLPFRTSSVFFCTGIEFNYLLIRGKTNRKLLAVTYLKTLLHWFILCQLFIKAELMMMNCFCAMVDRRKMFDLISSRDHYQKFSPLQISNTPHSRLASVQNLSSGFVE